MKAKKIITLFSLTIIVSSCHFVNRANDTLAYKSITGRTGDVYTTLGGQKIEYKNATIKYSESNSSTILIITEQGKDIYIQGPVIVEFNDKSKF